MTRIRRRLGIARARTARRVRQAIPNVLALAGVGCAAAGLAIVHPTLALLLVGGYLYWIATGIGGAKGGAANS